MNSDLEKKLTVLFSSTIVPIALLLWIGAEVDEFDPIPWLTLIVGSVFGLSVAITVSDTTSLLLQRLSASEEDKTNFAKFILISNFEQLQKIVTKYFETINETSVDTRQKRKLLTIILPSITTFLNICVTILPNVGNKLSNDDITKMNSKFIQLHKLIVILDSGSDEKFDENILNLGIFTKEGLSDLQKM